MKNNNRKHGKRDAKWQQRKNEQQASHWTHNIGQSSLQIQANQFPLDWWLELKRWLLQLLLQRLLPQQMFQTYRYETVRSAEAEKYTNEIAAEIKINSVRRIPHRPLGVWVWPRNSTCISMNVCSTMYCMVFELSVTQATTHNSAVVITSATSATSELRQHLDLSCEKIINSAWPNRLVGSQLYGRTRDEPLIAMT